MAMPHEIGASKRWRGALVLCAAKVAAFDCGTGSSRGVEIPSARSASAFFEQG